MNAQWFCYGLVVVSGFGAIVTDDVGYIGAAVVGLAGMIMNLTEGKR